MRLNLVARFKILSIKFTELMGFRVNGAFVQNAPNHNVTKG